MIAPPKLDGGSAPRAPSPLVQATVGMMITAGNKSLMSVMLIGRNFAVSPKQRESAFPSVPAKFPRGDENLLISARVKPRD